jgi:hypothetical protein
MITYMIDKILNYKTVTAKEKIDRLLEIDATQYCNLGCDSTKSEVQEAKKQSRAIYRAIKQLDPATGKLLLEHMDR